VKRRLQKVAAGVASLTALAGCLNDGSRDEQGTSNSVPVTREFNANSSGSIAEDSADTSTSGGTVSVGPKSGDTPPSETPNSDITRISFEGLRMFVHVTSGADVDAVAVVSPMGSQLAVQPLSGSDESVSFSLIDQTHGRLYPQGDYQIFGYRRRGSGTTASYEQLEAHTVSLVPELAITAIENIGEPGMVRLQIANQGTAPYPVSQFRVSRFWRTPNRTEWTEPERRSVIVQPDQVVSLAVDSKTERTVTRERDYEQAQEEFCNGKTAARRFEFRSSRLMTHRAETTEKLTLQGEAIQETDSAQTVVECTQISAADDADGSANEGEDR
jgi:hypothetical protein